MASFFNWCNPLVRQGPLLSILLERDWAQAITAFDAEQLTTDRLRVVFYCPLSYKIKAPGLISNWGLSHIWHELFQGFLNLLFVDNTSLKTTALEPCLTTCGMWLRTSLQAPLPTALPFNLLSFNSVVWCWDLLYSSENPNAIGEKQMETKDEGWDGWWWIEWSLTMRDGWNGSLYRDGWDGTYPMEGWDG